MSRSTGLLLALTYFRVARDFKTAKCRRRRCSPSEPRFTCCTTHVNIRRTGRPRSWSRRASAPRDYFVIFTKIYTALWDARAAGDSTMMPRQSAPPHRGGIHAREIRILELTQPPSRRDVRKSFKHFKPRLHPSTTWLENESTSRSERRREDSGPPRCHFSRPPREQ